jgi:hypothetical protein
VTAIDPLLLRKYQETEYRVLADGAHFVLPLERPSAELEALYRERRVASAAFMSAFNPYSQPIDEEQNIAANARLREELESACFTVLDAVGSDPNGQWKEPSFLVLDMGREGAEALGRAYRQNAIVFAGADAVPRLVLLR